MQETQSFRLLGQNDIEEVSCCLVDGQSVVFWEDIQGVFSQIGRAKNGSRTISPMRDSNGIRIVPHRIKHCPGVILDVVLSHNAENGCVSSSMSVQRAQLDSHLSDVSISPAANVLNKVRVEEAQQDTPSLSTLQCLSRKSVKGSLCITDSDPCPSAPLHFGTMRRPSLEIQEGMKVLTEAVIASHRARSAQNVSVARSIVDAYFPLEYNTALTISSAGGGYESIHSRLDRLFHQYDTTQMMLQEALNRMVLIERKTEAIFIQNYELLEYTIPRLFIVIPDTSASWDLKSKFRTKFRLHFICECGEHTEAPGSNEHHRPHLTTHEGYAVSKPKELFTKYGPLLILMLEMIKTGATIASTVVPVLASLKVNDALASFQSAIGLVSSELIRAVEFSIDCIEPSRTTSVKSLDEAHVHQKGSKSGGLLDLDACLADAEGMNGVDLRQLKSYLAAKDTDKLYGNLYRKTTADGHVKWVCRAHFEAIDQKSRIQKLREVVSVSGGKYDEHLGTITVMLRSTFAADEFYRAFRKVKSVLHLDVAFCWNLEHSDFLELKKAVSKSKIKSIAVGLNFSEYASKINQDLQGGQLHDPIFDIMRSTSIQYFEISGAPRDFFEKSSPLPKKADLSHLRRLGIGAQWTVGRTDNELKADLTKLKSLLSKAPNLKHLYLHTTPERLPQVFSAIPRDRAYPIDFRNIGLRFLPPPTKLRSKKTLLRDLTHLFEIHGVLLERLDLGAIKLEEPAMEALAEAIRNGSGLKELILDFIKDPSAKYVKNLTKVVAQSPLRKLAIGLKKETFLCVFESVQWESLRALDVFIPYELPTMKAHVEDMPMVRQRDQSGLAFRLMEGEWEWYACVRCADMYVQLSDLESHLRMSHYIGRHI